MECTKGIIVRTRTNTHDIRHVKNATSSCYICVGSTLIIRTVALCIADACVFQCNSMFLREGAMDFIMRTRSYMHDHMRAKNTYSYLRLRTQTTPHVRKRNQIYNIHYHLHVKNTIPSLCSGIQTQPRANHPIKPSFNLTTLRMCKNPTHSS